jgi:hypothetical protein
MSEVGQFRLAKSGAHAVGLCHLFYVTYVAWASSGIHGCHTRTPPYHLQPELDRIWRQRETERPSRTPPSSLCREFRSGHRPRSISQKDTSPYPLKAVQGLRKISPTRNVYPEIPRNHPCLGIALGIPGRHHRPLATSGLAA